ncbi:TraM recognition domain-containing protein (plasmid) [Nostoc sp. UHCC 0302]|uniref:type IV secretory system conjugative DNA transfer family protein n=1 Tax=Nostoc sp. UHCC 0302 TaxID=3134896 RepID=UPI00311CD5C9
MNNTTTSVNSNQFIPPGLTDAFVSPAGLGLLACGALLVAAKCIDAKGGKAKLATARWGGNVEKTAARKLACEQIRERRHNRVALFIGTPRNISSQVIGGVRKTKIPEDPGIIYLPDVQKGVIVFGGPGSGKSFFCLNRLFSAVISQSLAFAMYDFKFSLQESATASAKGQTPILAGQALKQGYKVHIFAPGFAGSAIVNPIEFLKNQQDSSMARQLAITINRNFKLGSDDSGNAFFSNAGDQLVQAVFMFAKGTKYPDIMMCQAILGLPKLVKRIEQAYDQLNFMVREAFAQFVSVAGSPETASSIVGTASGLFSRFMVPDVLAAFCGKTNIPLDIERKQMIVFGMDKEKIDVIGPLLASVLHLLVTRNVAGKRKTPLVLGVDEVPTIYLPALVNWLNQNREDGLVTILGLQNISMLQESYGDNITNAIFGGCATKFFFNPQEDISAKRFSEYLGNKDINYTQRSWSSGGKGGASNSTSNQNATRALFESNEFTTLPVGKAVIINPGFSSCGQISLPILEKINVSDRDIKVQEESTAIWYKYQQNLLKNSQLKIPGNQEMAERRKEAERLLPLVGEISDSSELSTKKAELLAKKTEAKARKNKAQSEVIQSTRKVCNL